MHPCLRTLLFLFISTAATAYGQELIFDNISSKLSIPSSECYNVMQDSKGYLWISTEQGLVRYDGNTSKIFDQKTNIPEKAVYAVTEDQHKNLWIATSKNRILYYENNQFKEIANVKSYQSLITNNHHTTFNFVPYQHHIYINSSRKLFIADIKTKKVSPVLSKLSGDIVFIKEGEKIIFVNRNDLYYSKTTTIAIQDQNKVIRFNVKLRKENSPHWRVLTQQIKSNNFFTFNNKLVKVASDFSHQVYELPSAIISIYADKNGGLWVGTIKKGVFYFPDPNKLDQQIVSLSNLSVSGICEDSEKNIWCTTLEDGVFFSKSKFVKQYANQPELAMPINLLKNVAGKLFVSPFSGGLLMYNGQAFNNPIKSIKKEVYNIFSQYDHTYFITQSESAVIADSTFNKTKSPKWIYKDELMPYFTIYGSNTATKNQITYTISYNKIFKHTSKGIELFFKTKSTGKCIEYIDNDNLLFGCANGLYSLHIPSKKSEKIKNIYQTVTKIYKDSHDKIWICTKGDGLYLLQNKIIKRLDSLLKIPTAIFYDLGEDDAGVLWAGTNKGLVAIKPIKKGYNVELYSTLHGLPSNDIYKIAMYKHQLFFSSPRGLASMPQNISLTNTTAPRLLLDRIEINDKPIPYQEFVNQTKFAPQQNNLKFTFNIFSYKNSNHQLVYSIQKGKKPIPVDGNKITLQNLKPDDYELTAYVLNSDGIKSTTSVMLNFTIDKPFWQKSWFIALLVLLLAGIILILRKLQIKWIKQKEEEKNRIKILIAQSKLAALQARMNPHFIFNAINSIQNYIFKNQQTEAQSYLIKFSRLIRFVLQQSAERFLSLQEELDTLKLYIELEKLRFKTAFDYSFEIDSSIDMNQVTIPTMLIQPYVENAIWHGLMNLGNERNGKLDICISQKNNVLFISIQDNGIGRKKASSFKKHKNYISAGLMLTEERLKTLQQIFDNDRFNVNIIDLYTEDEVSSGTRVEITLSLSNNYNSEYD